MSNFREGFRALTELAIGTGEGVLSEYMTLAELAAETGASERTCRRWCEKGLPFVKVVGRRTEWLAGRKVINSA